MKKRIFSLLLLSALLITSCATAQTDVANNTTATPESDTTPVETELTRENMPDNLPDDLDFAGETITILHRGGDRSVNVEITAEDTGDAVDSSIFNRNILVEDRLNIVFNYIANEDTIHGGQKALSSIKAAVSAGDPVYDILSNHMSQSTSLILAGNLMNLSKLEYLDFEMPWWNQSFHEELTIDNKLYFGVGEIAQTMLRGNYVTFYNMQMLENYHNGVDIFELVRNGEWTMDKFMEMVDIYTDTNGDGKADAGDIYGLLHCGLTNDAMFGGFDIPMVSHESGKPVIVMESERTYTFIERTQHLIFDNNYCVTIADSDEPVIFSNNGALFYIYLLSASDKFRDMENDYGILPCPKFNEEQESYTGYVHNGFSVFVIPVSSGKPDTAAAAMEALCAESYRSCTMAYYQTTVKEKLARDENVAEMIDLVHEGIRFDFGYIYSGSLGDLIQVFRNVINVKKNDEWASSLTTKINTANTKLADILETYSTLE